MNRRLAAFLTTAAVLSSVSVDTQAPTLQQLLDRATVYVHEFFNEFANIVAEEHLVQETTTPRRKRVLRSDFLMVRYPGAPAWTYFRDVFEVDSKPVRVQDGRLAQLFVDPPKDVLARAREISREGAKYNISDIGTLNNPLLAMAFLQSGYRGRFRFTLARLDKDVGPTVRRVHFQEFRLPTLIRGNSNTNVPANGLIWIDEQTGRVVRTELDIGVSRSPARIVTRYRFGETLGINVPAEMTDWYPDGSGEVRGVATYSQFRRFQVRTEEDVVR